MTESKVVVIGAGPVGLTLAIDLAWRGIEVVVVQRKIPYRNLLEGQVRWCQPDERPGEPTIN